MHSSSENRQGNAHFHSGPVTAKLSAQIPTTEDVLKIAYQVEAEMAGKPLNVRTAYEFVSTVRARVVELIVIEVS